jgi:hypothetical protein
MKKIVKLITEIPARLDGRDVDPLGRGMDWQHRDYELAYKIRKQIRAGYNWHKVFDELTNAERRTLTECKLNQTIQCEHFCCDRREFTTELTSAQAKFEMRNWDEVSLPAIMRRLAELSRGVGCVIFGNNAGQGLPLAQSLAPSLISERAAIIYAQSLPERSAYEHFGYRTFLRRSETASRLLALAKRAAKPLSLCFVNIIQHNQHNYHDP